MPRLRPSVTTGPGIERLGSGRGFRYRDAAGEPVRDDATLARIAGLVIPPAWSAVWIDPQANGHIQATGVDAAGRRQYLYHASWRVQKDRIKFDRALELAATLPAARRTVTIALRADEPSRERVLAGAFRMLDAGGLRVGSERYADEHGSFGLTTLRGEHVEVSREGVVRLRFPGKSAQQWDSELKDPDLPRLLATLKRRGPRAPLLAFRDERGWHPLSAADVNAEMRRLTGGEFTAKDFRTLRGTLAAAMSLARSGPQESAASRTRAVRAAVRETAAQLGNTPAVARSSYIDPRLLDRFELGETIEATPGNAGEAALRALLLS